jgi:glutathione synthase/RimK-type ligase-like ATP-grasp enzyme
MILIIGPRNDLHHRLVHARLSEKGASAVIVDLNEFPRRMKLSFGVSNEGKPQMILKRADEPREIDLSQVTAVWFRRWVDFTLDPAMAEEDAAFAKQESASLVQSLVEALKDCFWVNHPTRALMTDGGMGKIGHLDVARRLGLRVPRTMATNDPDEARAFLARCESGAIYKPFQMPIRSRIDEDGIERFSVVYTTELDAASMGDLEAVAHAPCIFQEKVPKKFELRVIVMGHKVLACEIHSQENAEFAVDFRRDATMSATRHVPHVLPKEIADKLIALNRELGLVYGAVDMIYTPDGRYVLLEVNKPVSFCGSKSRPACRCSRTSRRCCYSADWTSRAMQCRTSPVSLHIRRRPDGTLDIGSDSRRRRP